MSRLLVAVALMLVLFPAAFALVNACSDPAPSSAQASAAQQRFRTNFCYKQYRNQSDIAHCLARGI